MQVDHAAAPSNPAVSSVDTYGSGFLDSLMTHQVVICFNALAQRLSYACSSTFRLGSTCCHGSTLSAVAQRHVLDWVVSLLQDDHLDAALLEGLEFDLDMTAPEFAAMASAMVH
jgi:hypothetical protein